MKSESDNTPLPLLYDPGSYGPVAIKAKYNDKLAQAKLFEQFGSKVLRLKVRTQAALGKRAEELGIKRIGHGKIIMAGDFAEEAIANISNVITELQQRDPPVNPDVIVDLIQLQHDFNRQLLDTGKAHIDAEKQASVQGDNTTINVPFPGGTPMVVAIGKGKDHTNSIEDTKPRA